MIDKPFDDIEFGDLERLVENAVAESRTIEYKSQLPGGTDAEKKEFLADVSAFANTVGGDLLYGVAEKGGVVVAIDGVEIANTDAAILKYESIIMTGTEPKISVQMKCIETPEKKTVLLVRVAKSWCAPHRVVFKGHGKFHARNSGGKYSLDTWQLRDAFNLSQTLIERMKEFRIGRIFEVSAGNTPVQLDDGAKAILHFLPLQSLTPGHEIEIQSILKSRTEMRGWIFPTVATINFDGVLHRGESNVEHRHMLYGVPHPGESNVEHGHMHYMQIFRNGTVETVASIRDHAEEKLIHADRFPHFCAAFCFQNLAFVKEVGINPPAFVCLTLIGVKGYRIGVCGKRRLFPAGTIDRDILQLPEKLVKSYDVDPLDILGPMFDVVWQTCGGIAMPDDAKDALRVTAHPLFR